jgi:hypothetical protein
LYTGGCCAGASEKKAAMPNKAAAERYFKVAVICFEIKLYLEDTHQRNGSPTSGKAGPLPHAPRIIQSQKLNTYPTYCR